MDRQGGVLMAASTRRGRDGRRFFVINDSRPGDRHHRQLPQALSRPLKASTDLGLVVRQLVFLGLIVAAYALIRRLANPPSSGVESSVAGLLAFEQRLGLAWEDYSHRQLLAFPTLAAALEAIYQWGLWIALAIGLCVTWFSKRALFYLYRDSLAVAGLMVLVLVASKQVALNPSLGVGGVALTSVVLVVASGRSWSEPLLAIPPIVFAIAGVATGNYFVVDVIAGFIAAALALALVSWLRSAFVSTPTDQLTMPRPQGSGDRPRSSH